MATVYADSTGAVIAIARTLSQLQIEFPSVPSATAFTLDFDESQNVALLADLFANQHQYTVTAGPTLKKNGSIVVPAGSSPSSAAWRSAVNAANAVTHAQVQAALSLLIGGTATVAQTQLVLAYIVIKLSEADLLFKER